MRFDRDTFRISDAAGITRILLGIGALGMVASLIGMMVNREQLFQSYLVAYAYWATIGLGALFFTMLHHITNAKWSVVLRRISESVMITLPLMFIFFIPIVALGMPHLYEWSLGEALEGHKLELWNKKSGYLNTGFFAARTVICFAIWFLLARSLYRASIRQNVGHTESLTRRFRRVSAPGILLFALTLTCAAFDWLMSLDFVWYSTIFGVYVFSGSLLAALSFIALIAIFLRRNSVLQDEITVEHYHDLGKLMFAFVVFWTYIAFSQYFLIWYANIPEETAWFLHRWDHNWKYMSVLIIFGHFVFPFFVLISREPKRHVPTMTFMGIWLMFIHWVDIYWIITPNFSHHVHFSWIDVTTWIGIGGFFVAHVWHRLTAHPVVPVNDPQLRASIDFVNV